MSHHPLDKSKQWTDLPLELVEDIFNYLQHDKETLATCTLVVKSWIYPSRKHLFASVNLTSETYGMWQESFPSKRAELVRHVRALTCSRFTRLCASHGDYLVSLPHLQRLALRQFTYLGTNTPELFLAFQNTLFSLSIYRVTLTLGTFVKLVDYFPNLRELYFSESSFIDDFQPTPPFSRPPRGKLHLSTLSVSNTTTLSSALSGPAVLEYDELEIINVIDRPPTRVQPIISACEKTLTRLKADLEDCK